ncbi:MAG TPA: HAD family phosphatase [Solirubrobacteraceae bacterium]|jgi:putative hydrolase of the HAD superfamily|nr:HAD family phosphatase [Solirubrobacteraceae bacterium]
MASEDRPNALLIDFGGVLTSSVPDSFDAFGRSVGLPPGAFVSLLHEDEQAGRLFVGFEQGRSEEAAFERAFVERIEDFYGVEVEPSGFVKGLSAALEPDPAMIDVVQRVRAAGTPVAIVSNSFGYDAYEGYAIHELADEVVISGEVGVRKPSRRIFLHALQRLALPAEGCLFVDDLELNLSGAERLGIGVFHHRESPATVAYLKRSFAL